MDTPHSFPECPDPSVPDGTQYASASDGGSGAGWNVEEKWVLVISTGNHVPVPLPQGDDV